MPVHTVSLRAPILLINYCDVPHNNDHMQDEEVTWRELFIDNNATTYTHINVHFHLLYKLIQSLTTDYTSRVFQLLNIAVKTRADDD